MHLARSLVALGLALPYDAIAQASDTAEDRGVIVTDGERCTASSSAPFGFTCSSGPTTCSAPRRDLLWSLRGIPLTRVCITPRRAAVLVVMRGRSLETMYAAPFLLLERVPALPRRGSVHLVGDAALALEPDANADDVSSLRIVTFVITGATEIVARYVSAVHIRGPSGVTAVTLDRACIAEDEARCSRLTTLEDGHVLVATEATESGETMPPPVRRIYRYDATSHAFAAPIACRVLEPFVSGSLDERQPDERIRALVTELRAGDRVPDALVDYDESASVSVPGEACPRTRLTLRSAGGGVARSFLVGFDASTGATSFVDEPRE